MTYKIIRFYRERGESVLGSQTFTFSPQLVMQVYYFYFFYLSITFLLIDHNYSLISLEVLIT